MGQEHSLLDRIARADEGSSYVTVVNDANVIDSVLGHVTKMLNVRHGSVQTLPDYGLPDFNDMVHRFPNAINEVKKSIKDCLLKYEPRLSDIRINHVQDEDSPLSLKYDITARIVFDNKKTDVWFETVLDAAGRASIRG